MGVDVTATVVTPQFTAAYSLRLLLPFVPILLQAFGLSLGDMNHAAVLGRLEIGQLHHAFIEMAQWRKGLEIRGFEESEVMGVDAINVIHDNPFLLTDALPHVRSLTSSALSINLFGMEIIKMIDAVANHILNACGIVLRHVCHKVTSVGHRTDVGINHMRGLVGIFKEQLRLCLQGGEGLIGVAVVEL